jgi:prepilin-type N-terminal cleavage/methylation domain-containing protein/prepilin-type processing-associated H-X9-DG protein
MKRAFTLIEMLVVVGIVALLVALLLPSLFQAREQSRRAVCLANLKQLANATQMYLDQNRDFFWRDMVMTEDGETPAGCKWWFGFEPNGPAYTEINRPLDKKQSPLARHLRSIDDGLQCPSFPYDDGRFFHKFAARSASYGYNVELGPRNPALPTHRRADFAKRSASVFVFADGIHFDFNPGFNEGHYIDWVDDPASPYAYGGYAHFRHARKAQLLLLDGHAESQLPRGPLYGGDQPPGGPAANLADPAGGNKIYGF